MNDHTNESLKKNESEYPLYDIVAHLPSHFDRLQKILYFIDSFFERKKSHMRIIKFKMKFVK